MVIEAFVLPYFDRSMGVVFWEARRDGRGRGGGGTGRQATPDTFAVYAPGELSPGEVAALQASFVASLGKALHGGGAALGASGPLIWWWLGGVLAILCLT